MQLGGRQTSAPLTLLADTGSDLTLMQSSLYDSLPDPPALEAPTLNITAANGTPISSRGSVMVPVIFRGKDGHHYTANVRWDIIDQLDHALILGMDQMSNVIQTLHIDTRRVILQPHLSRVPIVSGAPIVPPTTTVQVSSAPSKPRINVKCRPSASSTLDPDASLVHVVRQITIGPGMAAPVPVQFTPQTGAPREQSYLLEPWPTFNKKGHARWRFSLRLR